jgi:DNA-binding MarR family transcriptional regulator
MVETPGDRAAHVLAELAPRLSRVLATALEGRPDLGLSLRQYRMLQRLASRPHRTTELALASSVTQPTASAAITSLESRGLVTRTPDPDDRRATLIALTDEGRDVLALATAVVEERLRCVTEEVTESQADALVELQHVLGAGMDRLRAKLLRQRPQ